MSWTPHSRSELESLGVQFGTPYTQGVVIDPDNAFIKRTVSNTTAGPILADGAITAGNSASELSSVVDAIGSFGNSLGSVLSGVSSSIGSNISDLMNLIQKNTDLNNAWSAKQAVQQNAWQERQNQLAMDFNMAEAVKNRDWQEMMSNTAHQREIADLQAAGLNPVLSASGGNGAAVTSGSTASGVTSSGSKGETDTSANSAIVGLLGSIISANASMENAKVNAQANMYLGEQQIKMQKAAQELNAVIQMSAQQNSLDIANIQAGNNYAMAQLNADNQRWLQDQQQKWNEDHPQNVTGAVSSAVNKVASAVGYGRNTSGSRAGFDNSLVGRIYNKVKDFF